MIIEKIPIPTYENRLGNGRKFGRKFGSALFFVRNFGTYCLSESSAEVRPNRKFGLSLIVSNIPYTLYTRSHYFCDYTVSPLAPIRGKINQCHFGDSRGVF